MKCNSRLLYLSNPFLQNSIEATRYSVTDIEDGTDDIPPPITDESPQSPDPTFTIADIPEPGVDDDEIEPELEALADRDQEASPDSNTLGLPSVQIIVTPGTPGTYKYKPCGPCEGHTHYSANPCT